jgi:hypothetical protein
MKSMELNCKPFEVRRFDIADLTNEKISMGVCKVKQPYQFMFYGRLLAGLFSKKKGEYSLPIILIMTIQKYLNILKTIPQAEFAHTSRQSRMPFIFNQSIALQN